MTDEQTPNTPKSPLEVPMAAWVRGGTTTYANDMAQAEADAAAEARRQAEAERHRIAFQNPAEARMHTTSLFSKQRDAMVVLGFRDLRERKILDFMMCELLRRPSDGDTDELMLMFCCPYCVNKYGRKAGDAQYRVHQSNRPFSLDQRTSAQRAPHPLGLPIAGDIWANPENPQDVVRVAGTITTHGPIKCDGRGCHWRFDIDDSVIVTQQRG